MTQPRSTLVSLDDTPWCHVAKGALGHPHWEPLRALRDTHLA